MVATSSAIRVVADVLESLAAKTSVTVAPEDAPRPDGVGPYLALAEWMDELVQRHPLSAADLYDVSVARLVDKLTPPPSAVGERPVSISWEAELTSRWAGALAAESPAMLRRRLVLLAVAAIEWAQDVSARPATSAADGAEPGANVIGLRRRFSVGGRR